MIDSREKDMAQAPNDIFVGNVHSNTTDEQLREIFCVVGTVKNVRILIDKETGRGKGYAFVEYTNMDSVNAAIRLLDKTELHGRALKVSHAAGTGGPSTNVAGATTKAAAPVASAETASSTVAQLSLQECWDILNTFKGLVDDKQARVVLETYPQLVGGLAELEKRLGVS